MEFRWEGRRLFYTAFRVGVTISCGHRLNAFPRFLEQRIACHTCGTISCGPRLNAFQVLHGRCSCWRFLVKLTHGFSTGRSFEVNPTLQERLP